MSMQQWIQLAEDIKSTYDYYEGFVILHGTDTLAYTASALSFMLENLAKSVIVTGAQASTVSTVTKDEINVHGRTNSHCDQMSVDIFDAYKLELLYCSVVYSSPMAFLVPTDS
uniref:L-asparaginase N-terminal domain-containing protein n=1 Tax=Timema monikensis TaxID=170555 RepID=A0A7R9HQ72_9NEOP|nr:unnamed protein product [Timema monikensis]